MVDFDEKDQQTQVASLRRKEAEAAAERRAQSHNLPYIDLNVQSINTNAVQIIPEAESRERKLVVFDQVDKNLKMAALSPASESTQEKLDSLKQEGYEVELYVTSEESLKKVWDLYGDISQTEETSVSGFAISEDRIKNLSEKILKVKDVTEVFHELLQLEPKKRNTTTFLETVMAGALSLEASDVHLEPQEDLSRVRYRLDGALLDVIDWPPGIYRPVVSRIKLLSGLKLNITDEAQDGRFSINYGDLEIEIRTSVIPGEYGESVVMRILNPESIAVPLEELGMSEQFLNTIDTEIKKPNGMLLNTGPTGSGKTTTLYASLRKIYTPEKKILTIENPIEYHLEGIVQTQIDQKRGYTFASGLRSALRQDPDVIMVGEIRDQETAETAINAALTGHLVFSTLHTNTAAGTFPRLIDLGVNPKVISAALNMAMAQRLVRRLCSDCKQSKKPTPEETERLEKVLDSIVDKSHIEELPREEVFEPVGCEQCNQTGYRGRVGVFEGILTTPAVEQAILNNPSEREITAAAKDQGLLFMPQVGAIKILRGETSMEEVETKVGLAPPF